jgi:hypothetical protein
MCQHGPSSSFTTATARAVVVFRDRHRGEHGADADDEDDGERLPNNTLGRLALRRALLSSSLVSQVGRRVDVQRVKRTEEVRCRYPTGPGSGLISAGRRMKIHSRLDDAEPGA